LNYGSFVNDQNARLNHKDINQAGFNWGDFRNLQGYQQWIWAKGLAGTGYGGVPGNKPQQANNQANNQAAQQAQARAQAQRAQAAAQKRANDAQNNAMMAQTLKVQQAAAAQKRKQQQLQMKHQKEQQAAATRQLNQTTQRRDANSLLGNYNNQEQTRFIEAKKGTNQVTKDMSKLTKGQADQAQTLLSRDAKWWASR